MGSCALGTWCGMESSGQRTLHVQEAEQPSLGPGLLWTALGGAQEIWGGKAGAGDRVWWRAQVMV